VTQTTKAAQTLGERLDSARSLAETGGGAMVSVMAAFIGALADDILCAPLSEIKKARRERNHLKPIGDGPTVEKIAERDEAFEEAEFEDEVGSREFEPPTINPLADGSPGGAS
jgi:hypothetical protein